MKFLFPAAIIVALMLINNNNVNAQTADAWGDEPQPAADSWGNEPQPEAQPVQPVAPPDAQPVVLPDAQPVAVEPVSDGKNLAEKPGVAYHSVGARFRWIFIPKWFITMFGVDAQASKLKSPMISNIGLGAEYTYRKDNFDITAAIWGAGLGWDGFVSFKGKGEPMGSWETVSNDLGAVLFTADFIWSSPIRDWVAITYGVGLGMGIPTGKIVKNEATIASGGILPCPGVGGDGGCEAGGSYNETYENIKVVPWINLLIGARFKPHEHMAIYVDGGFGLGFQMGLRAGYIF